MTSDRRSALIAQARFGRKPVAAGTGGMAITSHPLATDAAITVLRDGGNAVDAALCAAAVQAVVEPHMTSLCGVLSLLHRDGARGQTTYLNGSMNAPLAPLPGFGPADLATGRGVAVPGWWAAFEAAADRLGTRSRAALLAPAIELARDGFEVYPFLYGLMFQQAATLGHAAEVRESFFPGGALLAPGELLRQPQLAATLERLADDGGDHFYRGAFAERLVDVVQAAGGVLTRDDLEAYEVRWQEPARGTYRDFEVIGSPPPDNGGTHVIEILNLLEQLPLAQWGPPTQSPDTLYWMVRACGEVQADGAQQRDPEHFPLPLETILSKDYARTRLELMRMAAPRDLPPGPYPGSNHLTVIDGQGSIVTLLHSLMSLPWSNGLYADGVQLWAGGAHFLRTMPPPGGRASCYVAPTLVLRDGHPLLAAGSPGFGLVQNVVQNTVNILDFGLDIEASVLRPRFGGLSAASILAGAGVPARYMIESDLDPRVRQEVEARGIAFEVVPPWFCFNGTYEGVHILPDGVLRACADPRRTGRAEAVRPIREGTD